MRGQQTRDEKKNVKQYIMQTCNRVIFAFSCSPGALWEQIFSGTCSRLQVNTVGGKPLLEVWEDQHQVIAIS